MTSDTPIVVSGGSVSIDFDPSGFQKNGNKFRREDKHIKRIEITGTRADGSAINVNELVADSKATIKIYFGNP